ncbi:hypothetical protein BH721_06860 [Clostridium baratii]|nr:hypothetical protein BH721_06860 [Clostridium baratii]OPF54890.1 hypothetical protein BH724_01620 [Clostridium baratii]OPF59107.1 hypothetical protein BH725_10825 [Clostridium baratii]
MNIKDIRYFWRVYEERSINKAAKQLFITPQGLSKLINNLEEEFDTKLFIRSPKGMIPTESGNYLYENCRPLLDKLEEIQIGLHKLKQKTPKLNIGFSCGALNVFDFQKLDEYKNLYKDIEVRWEESDNNTIKERVINGSLDIGFVIGNITNSNLWSKELYSKKLNAIVYEGHALYEKDTLSIYDLKNESLITLNEKFYCYHSLIQRCHDFSFTPSISIKTMESQLIYEFCKQHLGIGIDVNIHKIYENYKSLKLIEIHDSIPWNICMIVRDNRKEENPIKQMIELF